MIGQCEICGKLKWKLIEKSVETHPGSGKIFRVCQKCIDANLVPESFNERYGISYELTPNAKFVKYVGVPDVTDGAYGANAYGSVLAEYDDGNRIGVTCGHGGSAWLCLDCAKQIINRQEFEKLAKLVQEDKEKNAHT